jgi:hypothetical protein
MAISLSKNCRSELSFNIPFCEFILTTQLLTDLLITVRTFHMFLLQLGSVM